MFLWTHTVQQKIGHKALHGGGGDRQYASRQICSIIRDPMNKNEMTQRIERCSWLVKCFGFQRDQNEIICAFNVVDEIVW